MTRQLDGLVNRHSPLVTRNLSITLSPFLSRSHSCSPSLLIARLALSLAFFPLLSLSLPLSILLSVCFCPPSPSLLSLQFFLSFFLFLIHSLISLLSLFQKFRVSFSLRESVKCFPLNRTSMYLGGYLVMRHAKFAYRTRSAHATVAAKPPFLSIFQRESRFLSLTHTHTHSLPLPLPLPLQAPLLLPLPPRSLSLRLVNIQKPASRIKQLSTVQKLKFLHN